MIPIKIDSISAQLPSSWDEVTLGQYIEMAKHSDELSIIRLLSILSGVDYIVLMNVNSETFDDRIVDHMVFIREPINVHELPAVDSLTINGKTYPLPDPSKCTIGQKLGLESQIRIGQDMNTLHADLVATAVAIYMQPLIDVAPYNDERIEPIRNMILELPLKQVYPAGSFFFEWLGKVLEVEREHLSPPDLSSEEERAGASLLFNEFHEFNTVESLAGNDPTKFNAVLAMDYNTAFAHLKYMNTVNKYQRKLNKILSEKK